MPIDIVECSTSLTAAASPGRKVNVFASAYARGVATVDGAAGLIVYARHDCLGLRDLANKSRTRERRCLVTVWSFVYKKRTTLSGTTKVCCFHSREVSIFI